MDPNVITLLKFSTSLAFPKQNTIASRPGNFKHLCVTQTDSCISTLYSLQNVQDNLTQASVIWNSKHVSSITFSDDGGYILLVLDTYDLQIWQICDEVTVTVEISVSQLEQLLQENNVSSDVSSLVSVAFSSSHAILSVSGRWMVRLGWSGASELQFAAAVEVPHCVAFTVSKETVYVLTTGGNVLAVSTDHMRQLGSVNLFSLLPQDLAETPGCFLDLTVSADGMTLAVVDDQDRLFLTSIAGAFLPCDSPAASAADWDCGVSIASKSSTASVTSNRSIASRATSFGIEVPPPPLSHTNKRQKAKSALYLSTWNSYMASLQKWKQRGKKSDSSCQLRLVDSASSGLRIASVRLTVAGVLVWFASPRGGVYRVSDVATGTSLAECCVPPGSVLVRGPGDVETFLSPDRLWLHLCGVSRDMLLAKLLHCLDASSVGRLLQGEEWGGLAMPITTLEEGLRHQHMHVVRFALGLHAQAFKRVMEGKVSNAEEGDEEEMLGPLDELFGAIRSYVQDEERRTVFSEQLVLLTLGHANALLQMVRDGRRHGRLRDAATRRIMSCVAELRRHLHVRAAADGDEAQAAECDWGNWPGMSEEEVVREAVSGGNVPQLLAFLVSCRGYTSYAAQQAARQQVDRWVHALLVEEQVHQAREILANFCCDPDEELHEVCISSRDSVLRDYLARHLSSQALLSETELTAWGFLRQLEAVFLRHEEVSGSFVPSDGSVAAVVPTQCHPGSLAICTVMSQSEDWRKDVLTVMYFNTLDETLLDVVDGEHAWACLLRHNRTDLLLLWAAQWFPQDEQPCSAHLDTRLSAAFAHWPLTQEMINHVGSSSCTKMTKDVLLDHFARVGLLIDGEKHSVCLVLMRLARCRKLHDMRTVLGSQHSSLGYREFEAMLVRFCTKHDLYHVALSCLHDSEVEVEGSEDSWWPLWREFRRGVGPGLVEATGRYLGTSHKPLVAVAETLYSGLPLQEVPAARDVPLLDMALVSSHCPSAKVDVNLYQLLRSFCPFNVSRLFSWQQTHTPSNRTDEPPHFSEPSLMSKYGYKDTLSFMHYLKQGRPSFAASMFIVEQFKNHRKLSKKAAVTGSNLAHGLALRHFQDPCVTAACISFIEMLGRSSQPARVHLAAASTILRHLDHSTGCGSSLLHQQQLSVLLRGLVQNRTATCAEFLGLLEVALQEGAEHLGVVAALLHWQPAVQFARLHNLRLPSLYLEYCVRHDKWLIFLLFVHIYNYPTTQVLELTKLFTCARLREHLHLALSLGDRRQHRPEKQQGRSRLQQPDSNRAYYSKIGISNASNTDKLVAEHGSPSQLSSSSSEDWGGAGEGVTSSDCHLENDSLFLTLLCCHGTADPHQSLLDASYSTRNPVYAVFACCYQPSSLVASLCTWLGVSIGQRQQPAPCSAASAAQLAEEAVCKGHVSTLARCWSIFLPDNPLCAFLTFLHDCVVLRTFEDSIISLKVFKAACMNYHNVTVSTAGEADSKEGSFVHDSLWIAEMAVRLANAALSHCFSSLTHQRMFLHTLCRASFTEHFPVEVVDYSWLWRVSDCLTGSGVQPSWSQMILCPVTELQSCLQQLLSSGRFSHAMQLAEVASLPRHNVLTAQWFFKFEQLMDRGQKFFVPGDTFFLECEAEFQQYEVDVEAAVGFFRLCASKVSTHKERYCLLQLALQWLKRRPCREAQNVEEHQLELEMWTCWLASDQTTLGSTDGCAVLRASLTQLLDARGTVRGQLIHERDAHRLELLIGLLLVKGDVATACRLEATFQHSSKELGLLLTSLQLAEGTTSPYQLPAELRVMLSATNTGYQHRMLRLSSVSSLKFEGGSVQQGGGAKSDATILDPGLTQEQQDIVSLLEGLTGHMTHAATLGRRVALCFRVAAALHMPFKDVLALEDPLGLLRTDFLEEPADMLLVAGGLIHAEAATAEEVADLLCHKIVEAICRSASQVPGETMPCVVWGCNLNSSFHLLLDLCADPSLLGYKLLLAAADIPASTSDTLQQVVELVVRAHDCFSAACNMEGIVGILRRAQIISRSLLQREEWGLLVRLLTGVGRYTEMSYIFHMLKKNNRFEFLLGKGMDKVAGLKTAALDFLEKHYSEDKDTSRIVGLHFQLHGRVGAQCLQEGEARLASLAMPLCNNQRTCQVLTAAMLDFSQAAQYLLQAEKLTAAMSAAHQAELVALQLSMLSTSPAEQTATCILRLSPDKVSHLITHTLSFPQACIVARAYGHPVDWGAALFQHCVVHGQANYLPDFSHNMRLTSALVEDVARRFQKEASVSKDMVAQMKKFVSCVSNVEVRYRVASQLGFRDIVESLLSSSSLAYLKDTVWRSGFRQ